MYALIINQTRKGKEMTIFLSIVAFLLLIPTILFLSGRAEILDTAFEQTKNKVFQKRSRWITGMLGFSLLGMIGLALTIPQMIVPGSF